MLKSVAKKDRELFEVPIIYVLFNEASHAQAKLTDCDNDEKDVYSSIY